LEMGASLPIEYPLLSCVIIQGAHRRAKGRGTDTEVKIFNSCCIF
jgi:hypothetical protein